MSQENVDLLANSDAVLALSLSTINFNLYNLLLRGVIRQHWVVAWVDAHLDEDAPGDGAEDSFISDTEISPEDIENWAAARVAANKAIKTADYVTFASEMAKIEVDYTGAWNATIDQIYVDAEKDAFDSVLLKIVFRSGKLYAGAPGSFSVKEYDLTGCVYAFRTKLSSLPIKLGEGSMIPEAEATAKQVISDSALTNEDFTIESIFMDLQRSNIADFDVGASEMPGNAGNGTLVAAAVSTMLNRIMADDDKRNFVLGYAVHPRALKEIGEAVFQPTSVVYSVSYAGAPASESEYTNPMSSFNFHMQVDNDAPVRNQFLPVPLLTGVDIDDDTEVDGVFALRYSLFDDNVLDSLVRNSLRKFAGALDFPGEKVLSEPQPGLVWKLQSSHSFKDRNLEFPLKSGLFAKAHRHVKKRLHVEARVTEKNGVLVVRFEVNITHNHKYTGFRAAAALNVFGGGTANPTLATAEISSKGGAPAVVRIEIKPGEYGKLTASEAVVESELDLEVTKFHPTKYFHDAAKLTNGKTKSGMKNKLNHIYSKRRPFENTVNQQMKEAFKFVDSIDALNIVMPLGNLYTFKGIGIRKNKVSTVLEATVGYAPVVEAESEE